VTFGREIDERQSFRVLDHAFARGVRLFDTAEAYGGGQAETYRAGAGLPAGVSASAEMHSSEKILGRWLKAAGVRREVAIQTKVARTFTPAHLTEALEGSLERLGVDSVDLYLFHSFDAETPLEVAMEAMDAAVRSGHVRVAGCSNFSAAQLREANRIAGERGLAPLETVQPIYNLARRELESELAPYCRAHGVAVISYSPIGAGFLAGKYRPDAPLPEGTRFDLIPGHKNEYFSERNFALVEGLRALAQRAGLSMARLALGWALAQPHVDGVLIGARHEGHIDAAFEAETTPLDAALLAELDALSAHRDR
jgi:aryl-alcohol dehydrogenase-like predicted oxidoreductase